MQVIVAKKYRRQAENSATAVPHACCASSATKCAKLQQVKARYRNIKYRRQAENFATAVPYACRANSPTKGATANDVVFEQRRLRTAG